MPLWIEGKKEKKSLLLCSSLRHIIMNFMISAFHFAGVWMCFAFHRNALFTQSHGYESNDIAKGEIQKCLQSHINSNGNIDAKLNFSFIILVSDQQSSVFHSFLSLSLAMAGFLFIRVCRARYDKSNVRHAKYNFQMKYAL